MNEFKCNLNALFNVLYVTKQLSQGAYLGPAGEHGQDMHASASKAGYRFSLYIIYSLQGYTNINISHYLY